VVTVLHTILSVAHTLTSQVHVVVMAFLLWCKYCNDYFYTQILGDKVKNGLCPDMTQFAGLCTNECKDDADCLAERKCCSTGPSCGNVCVVPDSQTVVQSERWFCIFYVNLPLSMSLFKNYFFVWACVMKQKIEN
jgi:hypothetical protein